VRRKALDKKVAHTLNASSLGPSQTTFISLKITVKFILVPSVKLTIQARRVYKEKKAKNPRLNEEPKQQPLSSYRHLLFLGMSSYRRRYPAQVKAAVRSAVLGQ
jgi:hypothetical protein